jgi:hypothetical protein
MGMSAMVCCVGMIRAVGLLSCRVLYITSWIVNVSTISMRQRLISIWQLPADTTTFALPDCQTIVECCSQGIDHEQSSVRVNRPVSVGLR